MAEVPSKCLPRDAAIPQGPGCDHPASPGGPHPGSRHLPHLHRQQGKVCRAEVTPLFGIKGPG